MDGILDKNSTRGPDHEAHLHRPRLIVHLREALWLAHPPDDVGAQANVEGLTNRIRAAIDPDISTVDLDRDRHWILARRSVLDIVSRIENDVAS